MPSTSQSPGHPDFLPRTAQAPARYCAVSIRRRIDKPIIIGGGFSRLARPAGQQMFNQAPLQICKDAIQSAAAHAPGVISFCIQSAAAREIDCAHMILAAYANAIHIAAPAYSTSFSAFHRLHLAQWRVLPARALIIFRAA
ncbi:hypothetical protein [Ottowia cancrivicina]|uniref:Uncharacterized protein n=1 Tax=Ottowia cancrivicina TaxID=3040346 RepID=A0AAW6RK56_9BURK|nr:hypothetical protein [Ottowia sp. 10c7w1]MDG9698598.1 hypothetical protein [Ottowia sp. 10c7w1]